MLVSVPIALTYCTRKIVEQNADHYASSGFLAISKSEPPAGNETPSLIIARSTSITRSRRKFAGALNLNSAVGSNSLLAERCFRRAISISGKSSETKEVTLSVLNPARSTLAFNSDTPYLRACREYSSTSLQRKECCGTVRRIPPPLRTAWYICERTNS